MIGETHRARRPVLLVEMNEITWRLVNPLCAAGKLPAFVEFLREGTQGAPVTVESPPFLDPWISWTTVYTGRPQQEHGVRFLEQPPETVHGPRIWDLAADAGKTLGIFGSIMSWPPRQDIKGFWVPSTFSPRAETVPAELQPIQEFNLKHTRAHTPVAGQTPRDSLIASALRLRKLGLRVSTAMRAASFLLRTRFRPYRKWEKVSLQPLVNLDFFETLYRRHQPDLATFHSNHVAHYQHRYWRSMDPAPFKTKPSAEEQRQFGPAIEFGYRVADELLSRICKLAGPDTVVIVASGLGAQPYVDDAFPDGRTIVRIRDIQQIVDLCGVADCCTPISMMAPQWNLTIKNAAKRAQAERVLSTAYYCTPETKLFASDTVGDTINFNLSQKGLRHLDLDAMCVFPDAGGRAIRLAELCATGDATPKEGFHDRVGVVMMRGPGIKRGAQLGDCTNLDLAPTILHLMGLPIPPHMSGRVLHEALEDKCDSSSHDAAAGRHVPAGV
jgi:hypothetical protein